MAGTKRLTNAERATKLLERAGDIILRSIHMGHGLTIKDEELTFDEGVKLENESIRLEKRIFSFLEAKKAIDGFLKSTKRYDKIHPAGQQKDRTKFQSKTIPMTKEAYEAWQAAKLTRIAKLIAAWRKHPRKISLRTEFIEACDLIKAIEKIIND